MYFNAAQMRFKDVLGREDASTCEKREISCVKLHCDRGQITLFVLVARFVLICVSRVNWFQSHCYKNSEQQMRHWHGLSEQNKSGDAW